VARVPGYEFLVDGQPRRVLADRYLVVAGEDDDEGRSLTVFYLAGEVICRLWILAPETTVQPW
jgi:hypothetical protein